MEGLDRARLQCAVSSVRTVDKAQRAVYSGACLGWSVHCAVWTRRDRRLQCSANLHSVHQCAVQTCTVCSVQCKLAQCPVCSEEPARLHTPAAAAVFRLQTSDCTSDVQSALKSALSNFPQPPHHHRQISKIDYLSKMLITFELKVLHFKIAPRPRAIT